MPSLRYHALMRVPPNERRALERERKELTDQLASIQAELDATAQALKARRERLVWQIRAAQKRMVEVDRRLAGS